MNGRGELFKEDQALEVADDFLHLSCLLNFFADLSKCVNLLLVRLNFELSFGLFCLLKAEAVIDICHRGRIAEIIFAVSVRDRLRTDTV